MTSNRYNFKQIEEKWQNYWEENKTFVTKIDNYKNQFSQIKDEIDLNIDKDYKFNF